MGYPTKIVTCCYCGTRAALVLKGKVRHELACASCGAPLHDLKMLRKDRDRDSASVVRAKPEKTRRHKPRPIKRHKSRRKGIWSKVLEEAFDVIEDIFD